MTMTTMTSTERAEYLEALEAEIARGLEVGDLSIPEARRADLGWLARNVEVRNRNRRGAVVAMLARELNRAGWQDGLPGCEPSEIYQDAGGDVWRAPASNVFDVTTGYRIGRWLAPIANLERYGAEVVIGPGFHPAEGASS